MPASTKLKSDASAGASSKRTRLANAAAAETVEDILSEPESYTIPQDEDAARQLLLELAQYARSLELEISGTKPKVKTAEEIDGAAEKLRSAARSGIRKQMTVRL